MNPQTPGTEDPIKYTKESLAGLRDVWLAVAQQQISKAAVVLEQLAEKLPAPLKKKSTPPPASTSDTSSSTTAVNAPS